jgi:asparagine synthase (glutamine-hydrolysing)
MQTGKTIETYSIGLAGSDDLKYARIVADYLGTRHNEIVVTEKEMLDAIPEVIYNVETYDTTTIRASVGNYLVAKYISEHSEAKVIFNGDGADELMGGYIYFHKCPDSIEFDKECRRLMTNIHSYDVLRSDKSISSNGLEARTPFLDRYFVQYYLSIHPNIRNHNYLRKCEKYLVRNAFSKVNFEGKPLMPTEVLWRTKEAFSDGVSKQTRSWYEIIQEHIASLDEENIFFTSHYYWNKPTTKEQQYYRHVFEKYYEGRSNVIKYFWMPKYVDAHDSSARTLKIYNDVMKNSTSEESEKNISII